MKLFHVIICTICFFLATLYFITSFLIWDPVHISIGLLLIFGTAWATARELAKPLNLGAFSPLFLRTPPYYKSETTAPHPPLQREPPLF